jgi:hypothetical protein
VPVTTASELAESNRLVLHAACEPKIQLMRGRGITSGRRAVRPDGTYYRESRRRRVSGGGRRSRIPLVWAAATFAVIVAVVGVVVWFLR